MFVCEGSVMTF